MAGVKGSALHANATSFKKGNSARRDNKNARIESGFKAVMAARKARIVALMDSIVWPPSK